MSEMSEKLRRERVWVLPDAYWRDRFTLHETGSGWRLTGKIRNGRPHQIVDSVFEGFYQVDLDREWRTRKVLVSIVRGHRSAEIILRSDGEGHWTGSDDEDLPEIEGTIDVDLFLTPATNTLPIRRLQPEIGQAVPVTAALVALGEDDRLRVERLDQIYERMAADQYRYSSTDEMRRTVFTSDLTVDEHGVVITYGELWRPETTE